MGTCHEGDDDDRQQEDHNPCHAVPPCAEHAGHFLFMRGSSGSAGVIADPAGAVQDGADQRDDQSEYVEIPQLRNIIRIHETLSGNPVPHDRCDVVRPGEVQDDVTYDDDEDRIAEKSLETVRHQQGNASARPDDDQSQEQTEGNDDDIAGQADAADHDSVGEPEIVDEEVCCDSGSDGIGDHFSKSPERRTEYAEELAAVTQFKELPQREAACFAPAVHAESGQCHEDADGRRHGSPESDGKARLVVLLRTGNQSDDRQCRRQVADGQDIPSRDTPCRKKIRDASRILA